MEAVHGLYGRLGRGSVVVGDETEAFREVCLFVDEDFGRDHVAERQERGCEIRVGELLGKVVDEEIATFRAWNPEIKT